ncbi:hypothetical protein G6O67_006143 [Ophiocordyceps sinensis]|uniref:Uncharacterized protein n=1 Tax=Ophiocordyceps sinensis TaxID=72228 RepID=A0A8H4LW43_9HYPO|nr:hypothetical protein G6O67_006143 [Ophiocordyceps sinensis]
MAVLTARATLVGKRRIEAPFAPSQVHAVLVVMAVSMTPLAKMMVFRQDLTRATVLLPGTNVRVVVTKPAEPVRIRKVWDVSSNA